MASKISVVGPYVSLLQFIYKQSFGLLIKKSIFFHMRSVFIYLRYR